MQDILWMVLLPAGIVAFGFVFVIFGDAIGDFLLSYQSEDVRFRKGMVTKLIGFVMIAFGLVLACWYIYLAISGQLDTSEINNSVFKMSPRQGS